MTRASFKYSVTVDKALDVAYIKLSDDKPSYSKVKEDGVLVCDYGKDDSIVGIEILSIRKLVTLTGGNVQIQSSDRDESVAEHLLPHILELC